jgi:hypothetical protein
MQNLTNENEIKKYQCGIRQICAWRLVWGKEKMAEYLNKHKFSQQFLKDVKTQWERGNRGQTGDWK